MTAIILLNVLISLFASAYQNVSMFSKLTDIVDVVLSTSDVGR